jgi:transposase
MKTHLTAALARQAVELYRSGLSLAEVASTLSRPGASVSLGWVRHRVIAAGALRSLSAAQTLRVELHGSHWSRCRRRFARQLTILRLAADGVRRDDIAARVGCGTSTVDRTIREYGAFRRKVAA